MSTVNGGCPESLEEPSERTSLFNSLSKYSMVQVMGLKSESEVKKESEAKQKKIDDIVIMAEKTSLCFLVDCTGSMSPWIKEVKKNVKTWSKHLHATHSHMDLQMSFVRYTDYDQPEDTRTSKIDFTTDLDEFYAFVDRITTPDGVGGDVAEDVFGGLHAMLKLNWPTTGTKVLIHIADAPCHGTDYHSLSLGDNHPRGDPAGLQLNDLMKQLAGKDIMYYFGYIRKESTSKMIKAFDASLQAQSSKIHSIRQFDVSDPASLLEGVFRSVTCSITTTLDILVSGGTRCPRDYTITENVPNWDTLKPIQALVTPSPPTGYAPKQEIPHQPITVKIAPQPFAEGGQRIVYHAYNDESKKHIVLKRSKWTDARSNSIKRCLEAANVQAIAANYADAFNRDVPIEVDASSIQFVQVGILLIPDETNPQFFTYETYMNGRYTKFNSNFAYRHSASECDNPVSNDTCQAFSHYTWVKSGRKLVICDLQGVEVRYKLMLTDPAIHYTNVLCHGSTNLGMTGILKFFQVHECNHICRALNQDKKLPEQLLEASSTTLVASSTPTSSAMPTIPTTK